MDKKADIVFDPQQINLFDIKVDSHIQITHELDTSTCEMMVGFGTTIEQNINADRLRVLLTVNLKREDDVNDLADFNFEFYFNVQNLKDFFIKLEEEDVLSSQMAIPLTSIALSTARGIIFEKLHDTNWKKVIIPVVSPLKIIKDTIRKV